jgi:uncharacterized repeat protein (TIGR03843 family)
VTSDAELRSVSLEVTGRITTASNGTYLGTIGDTVVVYKPVSGEKPLWDFPDGTLANREVAAFALSEAFGWQIVPRTWLREGPLGPGMVQLWMEPDVAQDPVDLVSGDRPPDAGWLHVLDGTDEHDRPLSLVHEDSAALRRMALFDVVANNADRKGAHILPMTDGHRHGVDHGLTFHAEHKLRTVLWGWVGVELTPSELDDLRRVRTLLDGGLGATLAGLLDEAELDELAARCERLVASARFPGPRAGLPAVPWPLF